jgi:hypothetical protein
MDFTIEFATVLVLQSDRLKYRHTIVMVGVGAVFFVFLNECFDVWFLFFRFVAHN